MDRQTYFDELRRTSGVVKPLIQESLAAYGNESGSTYGNIFQLVSQRTQGSSLLLKPLLVRLAYEAVGGISWERISPLCAAAELINISSYQANLSLDGKFRALSPEDKGEQFIASMITREVVSQLVYRSSDKISHRGADLVLDRFSRSNRDIYLGQYYDLSVLIFRRIEEFNDFQPYLKTYLHRCELLSGSFSGHCSAIGAILGGATQEQEAALEMFGRNFGIGLHIVNDIGDFAPPAVLASSTLKESCDQFSDIRKGKLTLPVMYMLCYANPAEAEVVRQVLATGKISQMDLLGISRMMQRAGAFTFSKGIAKTFLKQAKSALQLLPPSFARSLLSVMGSQIRTNKYFASLRS